MIATETLQIFVTVAQEGSFSAAANRLALTPSGVSRSITRLEKQLGVRLMTRTTRRLDLTEEGQWFLQRANDIINRLSEATLTLQSVAQQPSGLVRVNAATPVLNHVLVPFLAAFRQRYPDIRLELTAEESVIDLIEEKADLAIRVGALEDSTLNARLLFENRLRLVASPDYLSHHGYPATVDDLQKHTLLGFSRPASLNLWPLPYQGNASYTAVPAISSSNGETLRCLALAGAGIACLSAFLVGDDIRQGRLVALLPEQILPWRQPVWAVFYRQGVLAPRIRCLIDFLAASLRQQDMGLEH